MGMNWYAGQCRQNPHTYRLVRMSLKVPMSLVHMFVLRAVHKYKGWSYHVICNRESLIWFGMNPLKKRLAALLRTPVLTPFIIK